MNRILLLYVKIERKKNAFWHKRKLRGGEKIRVQETFELNQLKSAPSQLLQVFSRFD
jgi:hypothetical protein